MFKRTVALLLVFSIIFPTYPMGYSFAQGAPSVSYSGSIAWEGAEPKIGDDTVYIQVLTQNLLSLGDLKVEVFLKEGEDYSQVASQVEGRWLGITDDGREQYIAKMKMDGDLLIEEGKQYYIDVKDAEGASLLSDLSQYSFYGYSVDVGMSPGEISIAEIPSDLQTLSLEFTAYTTIKDLNLDELEIRLAKGNVKWGQPDGPMTPVASLQKETMLIDEGIAGSYYISGDFDVYGNLNAGDKLYLEINLNNEVRYAYSAIKVLGGSSPNMIKFNIKNGFGSYSEHSHDQESGGENLPPNNIFFIDNIAQHLNFEFVASNMEETDKLTMMVEVDGETRPITAEISIKSLPSGLFQISGRVTDIPDEEFKLRLFYDDIYLEEASIKKTDQSGVASLLYNNDWPYNEIFDLMPSEPIELVLKKTLNTTPGAITATLAGSPVDLTASKNEDNDIEITLKPSNLTGEKDLELYQNGEKINTLYYDNQNNAIGLPSPLDSVVFNFKTNLEPRLKAIENQDNVLSLRGNGFSLDKTYKACFLKKVNSPLTADPFEVEATYLSSKALTISSQAQASLPRGLYNVYLEEDQKLIKGMADVALRTPKSGDSGVKLPSVTINKGDLLTLEREILFNFTAGTYDQVRFAESKEDCDLAQWQPIPAEIAYTLSEGYGSKTLYFQFKSSQYPDYSFTQNIGYRRSSLDDLLAFGIQGSKFDVDAETNILNEDLTYTLFIQSKEANLTGIIEFLDVDDQSILGLADIEMKRTSELDGIYTYSKRLTITSSHKDKDIKKLSFYLKDKDGFLSKKEITPVNIRKEAIINQGQTFFQMSYYDQAYINNGTAGDYKVWGTPGFLVTAKLRYQDTSGVDQIQKISLSEGKGGLYTSEEALPPEAAKIIGIDYTLLDAQDSSNVASQAEEINKDITSNLKITGIDNQLGSYNGKYIKILSTDPWVYRSILIQGGASEFDFTKLPPSENYVISVSDPYKQYKEIGGVKLSSNETTNIELTGGTKPAGIKFTLNYPIANSFVYIPSRGSLAIGNLYQGFSQGETLDYDLSIPYTELKNYMVPSSTAVTIDSPTNEVTINLDKYEKIIYKGSVVDDKFFARKLEGATIYIDQDLGSRSSYWYRYHYDNVTTDENGNFEIELYKDKDVFLRIYKEGYHNKSFTIRATSQALEENKEIGLSYGIQNQVKVSVSALPRIGEGSSNQDTESLNVANNKIRRVILLEGDKEQDIGFCGSQSYIRLGENSANKNIRLKFQLDGLYTEKEYYDVALDEYGNGRVDMTAVAKGIVKATVSLNKTSDLSGYMLIYNRAGICKGIIVGSGDLSSESLLLENGDYTALFIKGYELDTLVNIQKLDFLEMFNLIENTHYIKKEFTIKQGTIANMGVIKIPSETPRELLSIASTSLKTRYNPKTGLVDVLGKLSLDQIDPDKAVRLEAVTVSTTGVFQNNEFYFNGKTITPNNNPYTFYPSVTNEKDLSFAGSLVPSSMEQLTLGLMFRYDIGGETHYESFGLDDIDMPKITLVAPREVFMGEGARDITVRGVGIPESEVHIYDNDLLVGKVMIPKNKSSYQTLISLSNTDVPLAHNLYAKMITKDGQEHITPTHTCEIIDPKLMAHVSNFEYQHGYGGFKTANPMDSSKSAIITYLPGRPSNFSFHINNLLKDQLEYVAVKVSNNGEELYYEAQWDSDVNNGSDKYSKWTLNTVLKSPGDFSVYYALKENIDLAPISGTRPIDFNEAIKSSDIDPIYMPEIIRDNLENREILTNTDEELNIIMPIEGGGYVQIKGNMTENNRISEADLTAQGYRKYDTLQGYYWAKETLVETNDSLRMTKDIYFSPQLMKILKESENPKIRVLSNRGLSEVPASMSSQRSMTGDDVLGHVSYGLYVEGVGEILNDTSVNPLNLGKVGTAMQVVGGAVLIGQVLSGPTSKDHNLLYNACDGIDDILIRSRIQEDIRVYDRSRRSAHRITSLFGGVGYGASFAGIVGKGLSYVVSSGGMVYDKKIGTELDIHWDAIMRDIQNEIMLQEYRKNKKKKPPKPGKTDDIKKAKWKIDPSGYVFEAIDSNRVEGVKATAFVYNKTLDDFFFWDEAEEWEEINPVESDEQGKYGWDVPEGTWKVKFEKEGYQLSETKSMDVPPAHEEVNIGLLSTKAPNVLGVAMDNRDIEIEFDMFMQGETLASNIFILDEYNDLVPIKPIEYVIGAKDTVYKAEGAYQIDTVVPEDFVKRIRISADDLFGFRTFSDDGETLATYTLKISGNVQSYAGVRMASDYEKYDLKIGTREVLAPPLADIKGGSYEAEQTITLSADEGATIYYTTDNSEPTPLSSVYKKPIVIRNLTALKFFASKVAMDDSAITSEKYHIGVIRSVEEPEEPGEPEEPKEPEGPEKPEEPVVPVEPEGPGEPVIPVEPTKPGNGGSSSQGGGGGKDLVTPLVTIDANKAQVKIQAKLIQGELTAKIDKVTSNQLIDRAKLSKGEMVLIEVETSDPFQAIKITHDKSFLADLAAKTDSAISYKTLIGTVSLSRKAIEALSQEKGDIFTLKIAKVKEDIVVLLEIDDKRISKIQGSIRLELPVEKPNMNTVVVVVDENGKLKVIAKSILSKDSLLTIISGSSTVRIVENRKPFNDIDQHWAKDAIEYVTARELFQGTAIGVFSPNQAITRGMLVTVLHRLEGEIKSQAASFKDVAPKQYYANAVGWASNNGIVAGVGDGVFAPDMEITREQLAVMMFRYASLLALNTTSQGDSIKKFADHEDVASWATQAMNYAVDTGLIRGKGDQLDPKGHASRAEIAAILERFIQTMK